MKYYKIELSGIPRVLRASSLHTFHTENDLFVFDGTKPEVELTFMQIGAMQKPYPEKKRCRFCLNK